MTLKQLLMFAAICRTGNFSRAAEELGVAQPALSRQIIKLEYELGSVLLDRTSRPVQPTAAGRLVFERAEQMIDMGERLKSEISAMHEGVGSAFTVGFVGSALFGRLPAILRRLREQVPEVRLSLTEMTSVEQTRALKEGRISVGFGRLSSDDAVIEQSVISSDRLVMAVPAGRNRGASGTAMDAASLAEETLILYPRSPRPSYVDYVLTLLRERGIRPERVWEVADLHSALGLVAADAGISIVPSSVSNLRSGEIAYYPFSDQALVSPVIMNFRRDDKSPLLQSLINVVQQVLDSELA